MVLICVLDKSKGNLKLKFSLNISLVNRVPAAAAAAVLILFPLAAAAAVLVRRRRRASGRLLLPQHGALVHSVALMRSHITAAARIIAAAVSTAASAVVPSFHALSSSRPRRPPE